LKKILTATLAAIILLPAVSVSAGTPGSDNGVSGKKTGKSGAARYTDSVFGETVCNETQHPKFDTVSCNLLTANTGLAGTSGSVGWSSDFDGHYGTFYYTVSDDGLHYSGTVNY